MSPDPRPLDAVAARLFTDATGLGAVAMADLVQSFPAMADYDQAQTARTREDLVYIVQFLAASLAAADDQVLLEFLTWLQDLLSRRGVPPHALLMGLHSLHLGISQVDDRAGRLLDEGREMLTARSAEHSTSH